jgi:hypothetical protein
MNDQQDNSSHEGPQKRTIVLILILFTLLVVSAVVILEFTPGQDLLSRFQQGSGSPLNRLITRKTPRKQLKQMLITDIGTRKQTEIRFLSPEIMEANIFEDTKKTLKVRIRRQGPFVKIADILQQKDLGMVQDLELGFLVKFTAEPKTTYRITPFEQNNRILIAEVTGQRRRWVIRALQNKTWIVRQVHPEQRLVGKVVWAEKQKWLVLRSADQKAVSRAPAVSTSLLPAPLLIADLPVEHRLSIMLELLKRGMITNDVR